MLNAKLPIKIQDRIVLLSIAYLGVAKAEIWIGPHEEGPRDDNDARVVKDRVEAEQNYKEGKTQRPSGISVFSVTDSDHDGYYELDTSAWPAGLYRLNYHGVANQRTPFGSPLDPEKRDLQYSWMQLPGELMAQDEVLPFIYWEPNGRGFCFRIQITQDGRILPAGNSHDE